VPAEPTIEDLKNNLTPLTKAEVEPMLLLDTSGSMTWAAADGSKVSKEQVVGEAIGAIVRALEAHNKNVRVITFDSVTDPATISNSVLALIGE
jgi:uncharacterized protein with von Willebrand factor type A (vWA) domain